MSGSAGQRLSRSLTGHDRTLSLGVEFRESGQPNRSRRNERWRPRLNDSRLLSRNECSVNLWWREMARVVAQGLERYSDQNLGDLVRAIARLEVRL